MDPTWAIAAVIVSAVSAVITSRGVSAQVKVAQQALDHQLEVELRNQQFALYNEVLDFSGTVRNHIQAPFTEEELKRVDELSRRLIARCSIADLPEGFNRTTQNLLMVGAQLASLAFGGHDRKQLREWHSCLQALVIGEINKEHPFARPASPNDIDLDKAKADEGRVLVEIQKAVGVRYAANGKYPGHRRKV